ncbi:glycoside hydrolase family 31 protein [Anaerocolumna sp.]|uniref:glycoside hydrolase family 31 protein n=1 Tax=Anaerocolumna sp. TaxID=2041569 RepID=UPI0028A6D676|nr:TIM-barrel domain-containing protein [Anaerocolumna sp.]
MQDLYKIQTSPICNPKSIIQGENYRFCVLTPHMIRMEYSESGEFEDKASQTVLNREFELYPFQVIEKEDSLEILTDYVHVIYDKKPFSSYGLCVHSRSNVTNWGNVWHYGDDLSQRKEMLGGTARTLDEADGAIPLESGLMSTAGYSIYDDSHSLLLTEDGWLEPRKKGNIDLYYLGYGKDYLLCLKEFYQLCGMTPLLPRFALGNWWSRYYEYTEDSYKELMERFREEGIPLSVAVIDMDWHLVNIEEKYGSGWTGYTWNKELFPNPERFMDWLHNRGMKVTLNVHPAEGVRAFEDGYEAIAKEMGVNIEKEEKVNFDGADPKFIEAYLKHIHHPNEDMGVDFWWIDWQQGLSTKIEGLDPLWVLNHYHYLDNGRKGKRPLILSRYAGVGSHRYPIGFSGDTVISWESLDFQPYFTANASNVGYGWWSHDIGGHMNGKKDDELETRWFQFGVFSPIMRLHSSKNEFNSKEPWRFHPVSHQIMSRYLRLRHQLIPYLYAMNYLSHKEGLPLVQPMYYQNPNDWNAYQVPNEYYFGTELIVVPITTPIIKEVGEGKACGWLPKGIYFDFFEGTIYEGNRKFTFYRDLENIPVLAKAGAIVPMAELEEAKSNHTGNPANLDIRVFVGADGRFELYEDDGETFGYKEKEFATTLMELDWKENCTFTIHGAKGCTSLLPAERKYTLRFTGIKDTNDIQVCLNGYPVEHTKTYEFDKNTLTIILPACKVESEVKVEFKQGGILAENPIEDRTFSLLDKMQIEFNLKADIYHIVTSKESVAYKLGDLQALGLSPDLLGVISEILLAYGH